jgi:diaminopimelate decarboxylase
MSSFHYQNNQLHAEKVSLDKIAKEVETPLYVYSYEALTSQFKKFDQAFKEKDHLICYSMKANSNQAILKTFINLGSGIDVVTGGELYRALKAGCDPQKIVFSGVGKSASEMKEALNAGILQFNVESEAELDLLNEVAISLNKKAPIALRVNPDVDPKTHPYISTGLKKSKFGINHKVSVDLYVKASKMEGIEIVGLDCHIGSQLTQVDPFVEAVKRVKNILNQLNEKGIKIQNLDLGGGLGIVYDQETPPSHEEYANAILSELKDFDGKLIFEPGRNMVGNSGLLLTKVLYNKEGETKKFTIVDAASNDLMRPSLYDAYHFIQPVKQNPEAKKITTDIVGPICETGDFFAHDREIQEVQSNDYLAIMSAGAYGFSMASTYNSRPKCAEVLVKEDQYHIIRNREKVEDLITDEVVPDFLT